MNCTSCQTEISIGELICPSCSEPVEVDNASALSSQSGSQEESADDQSDPASPPAEEPEEAEPGKPRFVLIEKSGLRVSKKVDINWPIPWDRLEAQQPVRVGSKTKEERSTPPEVNIGGAVFGGVSGNERPLSAETGNLYLRDGKLIFRRFSRKEIYLQKAAGGAGRLIGQHQQAELEDGDILTFGPKGHPYRLRVMVRLS